MKSSKVIIGRIIDLPRVSDDKTSCLFRIDNAESPIRDIVIIRATGKLSSKCSDGLKINDLVCVKGNNYKQEWSTLYAEELITIEYPWSEAFRIYRR